MKATLSFDLSEERAEFETCLRASAMAGALADIRDCVFRPARKHGYQSAEIQALIDINPGAGELIGLLEDVFNGILDEHGVEI